MTGDPAPPRPLDAFVYGGLPLRLDGWDDNPLFGFTIQQWELEAGLDEWALELGVDLRRGVELIDFTQDDAGVTVELSTGTLRAGYLVGCDGGRSAVRKLAGIGFPGVSSRRMVVRAADAVLSGTTRSAITEDEKVVGGLTYRRTERGVLASVSIRPGTYRVVAMEWDGQEVPEGEPATFDDVRAAATRVLGHEVAMSAPTGPGPHLLWRLTSANTRLADRYRVGRVLIAGDAAHVHSSIGAPGLNVGLQDAANLAWKLAAQIGGWAPAGLLDTYQEERRLVGVRVMAFTQAQVALLGPGSEITALREVLGDLLAERATTRRIATILAGADVRYPHAVEDDHPMVGRWVPDLPLIVAGREVRLAELARGGRPLLIDPTGRPELAAVAERWSDRVDRIVVGPAAADAVLIRPDGYVAWAGGRGSALAEALRTWFGEPADEPSGNASPASLHGVGSP